MNELRNFCNLVKNESLALKDVKFTDHEGIEKDGIDALQHIADDVEILNSKD